MHSFKLPCLWFFLIIFLNGKVHGTPQPFDSKIISKELSKELKISQKISEDNGDAGSTQKRKRRARGVEVATLKISEISFVTDCVYKIFKHIYTVSVYASFLHCVHLKRGPPSA